jgi:N-acetylneuraminic acid mutarotase
MTNECWTIKTPMPMPFKADGTCAVCDGKLYVFGGYFDSSNDSRKETFVYDPQTNSWGRRADMPTARWGELAIEVDGLIYVFGGNTTTYEPTLVVEVYNPVSDSWTEKADLPSGFEHGLMGVRYNNKIHLFCNKIHYEYDITTDTYIKKSEIPTLRKWGTCAIIGTKIYVIGGVIRQKNYRDGKTVVNVVALNTNEMYDLTTDDWTTKTPLPIKVYGTTRENPVINGKIYVVCGYDPDSKKVPTSVPNPVGICHTNNGFYTSNYVYDPIENSWEKKLSCNYPRDGTECAVLNGKLYVIGGRNTIADEKTHIHGLAYCEEYDPLREG